MFTNMFTDLYGSISRLVFSNLGELYVSDTVKHRFLSGFAVNRDAVNRGFTNKLICSNLHSQSCRVYKK